MPDEDTSKAMTSAIIGGVVQVIVMYTLRNFQGLPLLNATVLAFPFAVVSFLGFAYIFNFYGWFGINNSNNNKNSVSEGRNSEEGLSESELAMSEVGSDEPTEVMDRTASGEFTKILSQMGIQDASSELRDTNYEPEACLSDTDYKLFFMGIMGSKWVSEAHVKTEFERAIRRVDVEDGEIRFLLINPRSEGFEKLKQLREGAISTDSLNVYNELVEEYDPINVRLYSHLPSLRLIFIDDNRLVLSRYRFERDEYMKTEYGWKIPHLEIQQDAPWSLYQPLNLYYEQVWQSSTPIGEVDI